MLSARAAVLDLDPATYRRHPLHAEDRVWVEKNCYIDIWIEVVHALGLEPLAMMPFAVALDFEGDQFTFYKPPHADLWDLYGVDVQELNVWRTLLEHAAVHLADGKLISTEADAFWLPDTAGTDYRRQHTKTTIVLSDLDVDRRRLGYFHNAGYHALEGEDFEKLFRVDAPPDPAYLPLYAELVRIDRRVALRRDELGARSRDLLRRHLSRRPKADPVARFAARFADDLSAIQSRGLDYYHLWAFANVRQLGSAAEALGMYLRWLDAAELADAAAAFDAVSTSAKATILKAARAVNARRALDARALLEDLQGSWRRGVDELVARLDAGPPGPPGSSP